MNGKRFNTGKTRHDLTPAYAQEQYAKVLTMGAEKYGEHNWRSGMKWSKVIASMERHLQAIKRGEDFDKESGLLHSAHVMCNAAFLTEYYKICPQGDDRPKLLIPRIGLDIDEVLCDFVGGFMDWFEIDEVRPSFWNDKNIVNRFDEIVGNEEFWMGLKPLISPEDLPFEPVCYITSRTCASHWTERWLKRNGFPAVPVLYSSENKTKSGHAIEQKLDIFVDDRYSTYVEMTKAGVCCFLMDAPHNKRYDVGFKRIFKLNDIFE